MSNVSQAQRPETVSVQVQRTRRAARELARLSTAQRNQILIAAADRLEARAAEILKANQQDCEFLKREGAQGTASAALLKPLKTYEAGNAGIGRPNRDV